MLGNFCFFMLALLAFRSLVLSVAERKPWSRRLADLIVALLFAFSAVLLAFFLDLPTSQNPVQTILLFIALALIVGLLTAVRLRRPYRQNLFLMILKTSFVLVLFFISFALLMMSGFLNLTHDQPILKITMTGDHRSQYVEWKPPNGAAQKQNLTAREVLFFTAEGEPVARLFVYGDQVAVKAKIIRFKPFLNLIGFHNLFRLDYVYNGYTTAQRHNTFPHLAQEITLGTPHLAPVQRRFWRFWEKAYFQQRKDWWIKSATLESNYFPLVLPDGKSFRGSYYLTITGGGLSAIPLP